MEDEEEEEEEVEGEPVATPESLSNPSSLIVVDVDGWSTDDMVQKKGEEERDGERREG